MRCPPSGATGDAQKFQQNVAIHMRKCKMRLLWHVSGKIYASHYNKVRFRVQNDSKKSVTGVKLIVTIPEVAAIFDSRPSVEPMPEIPEWPSPLGASVDPDFLPSISAINAIKLYAYPAENPSR